MLSLNYDLYLEQRDFTLKATALQRGMQEFHRLVFGAQQLPSVDVVYGHNPADLDTKEANMQFDATRVQTIREPLQTANPCESKDVVITDEELEARALNGQTMQQRRTMDAGIAKKFVDNFGRAQALFQAGKARDALSFLRRCVNAIPDDFHSRWMFATVLRNLDMHSEALRQLRCAVSLVPDEMLTEYFRVYLVCLKAVKKLDALQRVFEVIQRHAPLGWKFATQITRDRYLLEADGHTPQPVHPDYCSQTETAQVCQILFDNFQEIQSEAMNFVRTSQLRNEDPFEKNDDIEQELASGGSFRLFDQHVGRIDADGCKA
eukprot:SAG31_NODE_3197_length_4567_cov_2.365040_6_plen_320_part_00